MPPQVTVITPTVPGRQQQLDACKLSVQEQTVQADHLILEDTNGEGPAVIRNRLVDGVTTEWVLPLDDDDTLDPECVETLLQHADDADIVYPWVRCSPELAPMWQIVNKRFNPQRLFIQNYIPVTALIRTDTFRMLGGYRPVQMEDWDLWRRAVLHGARFRCAAEVLWTYNFHDQQNFQEGSMRILCGLVTHNRLEYTKQTVTSLLETAGPDFHLVVADNLSDDGTQDWLTQIDDDVTVVLLDDNLFPGAATNIAWHHGLKVYDAELLMRSDNDIEYLKNWWVHVDRAFENFPELGQLGILNRHEDYDGKQPLTRLERNGVGVNVEWTRTGGNCVIPRRLYDVGLRWEGGAWQPGGNDEDSRMSQIIRQNNLVVAEVIPTVANNMSYHRYEDYPDYYDATAARRGLVGELSV